MSHRGASHFGGHQSVAPPNDQDSELREDRAAKRDQASSARAEYDVTRSDGKPGSVKRVEDGREVDVTDEAFDFVVTRTEDWIRKPACVSCGTTSVRCVARVGQTYDMTCNRCVSMLTGNYTRFRVRIDDGTGAPTTPAPKTPTPTAVPRRGRGTRRATT